MDEFQIQKVGDQFQLSHKLNGAEIWTVILDKFQTAGSAHYAIHNIADDNNIGNYIVEIVKSGPECRHIGGWWQMKPGGKEFYRACPKCEEKY